MNVHLLQVEEAREELAAGAKRGLHLGLIGAVPRKAHKGQLRVAAGMRGEAGNESVYNKCNYVPGKAHKGQLRVAASR